MASLLPLKQIKPGDIASEDYCVFGGTFDPIHQGHVSVIKQLTLHFRHILVAPTEKNPWKNEQPPALSLRLEMIELVFSDENIDTEQMGVELVPFPYVFSRDLVDYLRRVRPGNPWWAVGEDSAESVSRWS